MKFTMERDAAQRALTLATRIIERRNTIPILSHAVITAGRKRVTLAVTNIDRHMLIEIPGASTQATGETTASAANMLAFVRATAAGSQVELELTGEKLVLRSGRARASLLTLPAADFPKMPHEEASAEILVAGDVLAKAIGQVAHAQSSETTRYYLNGIYLHAREGKLGLVATDGHRLGLAIIEPSQALPEFAGIIVPREAVPELLRIATEAKQEELTLEISPTRLRCAQGDVEFSTKLIDGTFPDYDRVIPRDNDCRFAAGRVAFTGAVARCATLGSDETSAVRLSIDKGTAELSRRVLDAGEVSDELEVQLDGKAAAVTGFNSSYMTAALEALACPDIDVEFTPGGPIVMRRSGDRDGQLQIVMAMRV